MCKKANQSIFAQCFESLLKQAGRSTLTNKDARKLIAEKHGCAGK
jgi:hypothetical protein